MDAKAHANVASSGVQYYSSLYQLRYDAHMYGHLRVTASRSLDFQKRTYQFITTTECNYVLPFLVDVA